MSKTLITILFVLLLTPWTLSAEVFEVKEQEDIENAFDNAKAGDTIKFYPGSYEVDTLVIDVPDFSVEGVDTKNTILKSVDGEGPIIDIQGVNNINVERFTFLDTTIGILVRDDSSGINISNNVFRLGDTGTAIEVGSSVSGTNIINNTFFDNNTNLFNSSTGVSLNNNIFASYSEIINNNGTVPGVVTSNCFENNETQFDADNVINADVNFVDIDEDVNDFHLQNEPACVDIFISQSDDIEDDAGAYGGAGYDKAPDSVEITSFNEDGSTITVEWAQSKDYLVQGYKLYYSTKPIFQNAKDFLNLDSRQNDTELQSVDRGTNLNHIIMDLLAAENQPVKPTSPVLNTPTPGNNKIALSWTAVENATSYVVVYKTGEAAAVEVDAGTNTSYEIRNLVNNQIYNVWVYAKNQLTYYLQVAAYVEGDDDEFVESYFVKEDTEVKLGAPVLSDISNTIAVEPEAVVAFPTLPNEGCFVATAAFGFYSAEQVQVLRSFRDRHLLTNELGRYFVSWYYEYGPHAALFINEYPVTKPLVRAMLYPLIISASILEKSIVGFFLFISFFIVLISFLVKSIIFRLHNRVNVL